MDKVLRFSSPWISWKMESWALLIQNRKTEQIKKEGVLYNQGDPPEYVFLVAKGRIRITSYQASGRERQVYIAEKGCIAGTKSSILQRPHTSSAIAIVDSSIYRIRVHDFFQAMESSFPLCQSIMQMICQKQDVLCNQLLGNSFSQALQQISRVIINLVDQYGEPADSGIKISIRFTHQDIAYITGISRVTVSNTFSRLAGEGLLDKQDGHLIVCNIDKLLEYAEDSENTF